MSLNELAKEIHQNAVSKGFYDKPTSTGERLMLIVSELSEALEADRKGKYTPEIMHEFEFMSEEAFKFRVKDTFEDELADAVIRILDMAAYMNINIEWHVRNKMNYNATRERLHGKKY